MFMEMLSDWAGLPVGECDFKKNSMTDFIRWGKRKFEKLDLIKVDIKMVAAANYKQKSFA